MQFMPKPLARLMAALVLGAAAATTLAVAADPAPAKLASADKTFVEKATRNGLAEVELGRLAQQNAAEGQVKAFGDRMAADHGRANSELAAIAKAKGIALPSEPDKEARRQIDKLGGVTGLGFDRAYMNYMVADHRKDVADFRKHARSGKDADIKAFAAKTLLVLEEHLKHARLAQAGLVEATRSGDAAATATR